MRATLTGVKALGADFVDADLRGAVLAEGDFTGAEFTEARMAGVDARRARLGGVSLVDADLRRADLSRADLSHADLRRANLTQGVLVGASFTGAKIEGLTPAGAPAEGLLAGWVDISPAADGSHRLDGSAALAAITGALRDAVPPEERRYFGRSDTVKNASFDFGNNARVEIDSRLEGCTIILGPGAELVVGQAGALLDCQVKGGARLIVHGRVFEREAPAIDGTGAILIGATGSMQGIGGPGRGRHALRLREGLQAAAGHRQGAATRGRRRGSGRGPASGRQRRRAGARPHAGDAVVGHRHGIRGDHRRRGRALHRQPAHRGRHRGARRGGGRSGGPAHRGRGAGRGLGAHEGGRAARLGRHRRARWRRTPSSWVAS